jgi:hypothetical protein
MATVGLLERSVCVIVALGGGFGGCMQRTLHVDCSQIIQKLLSLHITYCIYRFSVIICLL